METLGTIEEWIAFLKENDFGLVRLLLAAMYKPASNAKLKADQVDCAATCAAYAANFMPDLMHKFLTAQNATENSERAVHEVACTECASAAERAYHAIVVTSLTACERIEALVAQHQSILSGRTVDNSVYVGFDVRDIKDFNLEGIDVPTADNQSNAADEIAAKIQAWLLVLWSIFRCPVAAASPCITNLKPLMAQRLTDASMFYAEAPLSPLCVHIAQTLLYCARDMQDESYELMVKVIAGLSNSLYAADAATAHGDLNSYQGTEVMPIMNIMMTYL